MPDNESTGGHERRRYTRLPLQLDALVALGPRPPIVCVVKDFCVAGVFIQIDMRQLRFVQARTPATLQFALTIGGKRQDLQMALTVCRVTSIGLGVAFQNPDPKTVSYLAALAETGVVGNTFDPATTFSGTQRRFVPEFGRILPKLQELVERTAGQMATEFTRNAADGLFVAARDARNNREQSLFIDAQAQFQKRIAEIKTQVPATLSKAVIILDNPLRGKISAEAVAASSLSLIDKDEFEEFLTVSELVAELEGRFKTPLFELNKRLGFLAKREMTDASNPLGPTAVCNSFAEVLKGFGTELTVSGIVYQMLRKTLDTHLERLYLDGNKLLIENNILPQIEPDKLGIKRTPLDSRRPNTAPSPLEDSLHPAIRSTVPPANLADTLSRYSRSLPRQWGAGTLPPLRNNAGEFSPGADYGRGTPHAGAAGYGAPQPIVGAPPRGAAPGFAASPGGGISAAAPMFAGMPGGGFGGGIGPEVTFSGFGYGPAVGMGPSLQQAFSTAQHQLALRRQIMPGPSLGAGTPHPQGVYSPHQIAEGLTELQQSLTATSEAEFYGVEAIQQRVIEALQARGMEGRDIGQVESDVIEIVVNLFEALFSDGLIGDFAKGNLKRLQGVVHKAALTDQEFLASTQHPLRQLLNRMAMLRRDDGPHGQQFEGRMREMVNGLNMSPVLDRAQLAPLLEDLEGVIRQQRQGYDENIHSIVEGCEDQQRVLRERRERTGGSAEPAAAPIPPELSRWITRAKAMRVGDRMLMNANTKNPYPVSLVWIAEGYNPYVFADPQGQKSASLTLQQMAMYLRRGLIKGLQEEGDSAVDRALVGVVNRLHEAVAEQAAHDGQTGLHNRRSFTQTIESMLSQQAPGSTGAALAQLSLENLKAANDAHGVEAGDQLITQLSDALKKKFEQQPVVLGRLGGSEWGIFWSRGGLQSAYRETQTLLDTFGASALVVRDDVTVQPKFIAGMAGVEDELMRADALMSAVNDACGVARGQANQPIYIAGTDTRQRKQLEQMVTYVEKALSRDRLALLFNEVRGITRTGPAAAHVIVSAEDRNGKLIPPALFSQAASTSAHAYEVDLWTLKHTLRWMAVHLDELERFSAFIIPLSWAALAKDDLANLIVNELMETAVPPARVCFEITDKDAVSKLNETADLINTLREFGCQFILAEFGGGQTNYEYLKELAVDFVCIQSSFIVAGRQDPKDLTMARSINEFAHFMGKLTIARLHNDPTVMEMLRDMKVDFVHDTTRSTRLVFDANG